MGKTLILYYSQHGTTKLMAEILKEKLHADSCRIDVERKYDNNMWKATRQAIVEIILRRYPKISNHLPNLSQYDTILIGGPTWGWSVSNPIRSYMRQTNLKGKKVASFWTYMDGAKNYDGKMRKLAKGASYISGIGATRQELNQAE